MKTRIAAIALLLATAAAVAYYPAHSGRVALTAPPDPQPGQLPPIAPGDNQRPRVEVVFALDTTGSMSGLIQAAKEKIWSIASTMASAQPAPEIRMGLVAYRDRGDAYVTQRVELSSDLDSVYAKLMDFAAQGGGDEPESVNQALYEAVHDMAWSQDPKTYKVVFLVGDAPPHMDYPNDVKFPKTLEEASRRGIVVNTVQCGTLGSTTPAWQRIAQLGQGRYFQVDQAGSAVAVATPFDAKLAKLSADLDDTRMYYGSKDEKAKQQAKIAATDKLHAAASIAAQARRATFNASASGGKNLLGDSELVDDVSSGRVDLGKVERDELPAPMQAMAPAAQAEMIKKTAERRNELKAQIGELARQREAYLKDEVAKTKGAEETLDGKIYRAVKAQGASHGLRYEANSPSY